MTTIYIPYDQPKMGSAPPAIHYRLSSPPPRSPPTLDALSSRILKSVENREAQISRTVSSLQSRHTKIELTRSSLAEEQQRKMQTLQYHASNKMDKALANANALQTAHVSKIAAHNSSVEDKSLKAREAEATRLSTLASRTLSKMSKAVARHESSLNDTITKAQSHNEIVSTKLDLVTQLKVQRLEEIKSEAAARLERAISAHELLTLATSLRCQQHNEGIALRFESVQAKREAKMKVLNSSITIKVLQAELNHACLISEIVQSCGVHSRTVMEKGGEAIRERGERTLELMKDQYQRESAAACARDDHLMLIQAAAGGKSRMAIFKGAEATRAKEEKTCQTIIDAAMRDSAAAVFRITKLADIVADSGEHCRAAMAKGLEASSSKAEALKEIGLANLEKERAAAMKREALIKAKVEKASRSPNKRVEANISPLNSPGKGGRSDDRAEGFEMTADSTATIANKLEEAAARREALLMIRSEQCGQAVARAKAVAKNARESPMKATSSSPVATDSPLASKKIHFDDELLPPPAPSAEEDLAFAVMPPVPPPTEAVSRASSNESWVDVASATATGVAGNN